MGGAGRGKVGGAGRSKVGGAGRSKVGGAGRGKVGGAGRSKVGGARRSRIVCYFSYYVCSHWKVYLGNVMALSLCQHTPTLACTTGGSPAALHMKDQFFIMASWHLKA